MFRIGDTYIDKRDNTLWVIENYEKHSRGILFTVHNSQNQYKRHYKTKLKSIATHWNSFDNNWDETSYDDTAQNDSNVALSTLRLENVLQIERHGLIF